eukprot:2744452-Amphidinium_carterae.2
MECPRRCVVLCEWIISRLLKAIRVKRSTLRELNFARDPIRCSLSMDLWQGVQAQRECGRDGCGSFLANRCCTQTLKVWVIESQRPGNVEPGAEA